MSRGATRLDSATCEYSDQGSILPQWVTCLERHWEVPLCIQQSFLQVMIPRVHINMGSMWEEFYGIRGLIPKSFQK